MRHNALQRPIARIGIGLSAMEARHRPRGDGKVVDDRDDDNAPSVLAIRAGGSAIINRWISSLVFGSFSTIHTTTDWAPGQDHRCALCGVTEGETQWRIEIGNGSVARGTGRCFGASRAKLPIQAPI